MRSSKKGLGKIAKPLKMMVAWLIIVAVLIEAPLSLAAVTPGSFYAPVIIRNQNAPHTGYQADNPEDDNLEDEEAASYIPAVPVYEPQPPHIYAETLQVAPLSVPETWQITTVAQLNSFLAGTLGANHDNFIFGSATVNSLTLANAVRHGRPLVDGQPFTGTINSYNPNAPFTIINLRLEPQLTGRTAAATLPIVNDVGFIRLLGDGAEIRNINIRTGTNPAVTAAQRQNSLFNNDVARGRTGANQRSNTWNNAHSSVGALAGRVLPNSHVTIENVSIANQAGTGPAQFVHYTGLHSSNNTVIGGLIGRTGAGSTVNVTGAIINMQHIFEGTVTSARSHTVPSLGGIIGEASGAVNISDSTIVGMNTHNSNQATANHPRRRVSVQGGFIGTLVSNMPTTITNSTNNSDIILRNTTTGIRTLGGFIGRSTGAGSITITDSTNSGAVSRPANNGVPAGGFIGYARSPISITNSTNSGAVTGCWSGGFVGHNSNAMALITLTNVHNRANIGGNGDGTGGFIGIGGALTVTGYSTSHGATPTTNLTLSGDRAIGGVIGRANGAVNISDMNGRSTMNAGTNAAARAGGFVGYARTNVTIENATNYANITGTRSGGIVGHHHSGTVRLTDVHNAGAIGGNGNATGGLVGQGASIIIINNSSHPVAYPGNAGAISGNSDAGGLVGFANGGVSITNAHNRGTLTGVGGTGVNTGVGGLVGRISGGTSTVNLTDVSNTQGISTGAGRLGGLIGRSQGSGAVTIMNATNSGGVNNTNTATSAANRRSNRSAGGFIGDLEGPLTITNGTNSGAVHTSGQLGSGGIVGRTGSRGITTLTNVHNTGVVSARQSLRRIGGLIGHSRNMTNITDSSNTGNLTLDSRNGVGGNQNNVGGIIGQSASVNFYNVTNTGDLTQTIAGANTNGGTVRMGGLIGFSNGSISITGLSYNTGDITGARAHNGIGHNIGGIVGRVQMPARSNITITDAQNHGRVGAGNNMGFAGGIVGNFQNNRAGVTFNINNVVNTGDVHARAGAGGIVGRGNVPNLAIRNAMNYGDVSTQNNNGAAGGIVGRNARQGLLVTHSGNEGRITTGSGIINSTTAANTRDPGAGGIVGNINRGTNNRILYSYNAGRIEGAARGTGGIVGSIGRAGTTQIRNVYNIGSVSSRVTTGSAGNGILGLRRNVVGNVTIQNAYNAGNVSHHPIFFGSGTGGAIARENRAGDMTRRMSYMNVYSDATVHTGNTLTGRRAPGVTFVPTSVLTSGNLFAFGDTNTWLQVGWAERLSNPLMDDDGWESYPWLAWQTGGQIPEEFFHRITPGPDHTTESGTTTVRFFLADDDARTFNPYQSRTLQHGVRPGGNIASITVVRPIGNLMSVGLISRDTVVGFDGNEMFTGAIFYGIDAGITGIRPDGYGHTITWSDIYTHPITALGPQHQPPASAFTRADSISGMYAMNHNILYEPGLWVRVDALGYYPAYYQLSEADIERIWDAYAAHLARPTDYDYYGNPIPHPPFRIAFPIPMQRQPMHVRVEVRHWPQDNFDLDEPMLVPDARIPMAEHLISHNNLATFSQATPSAVFNSNGAVWHDLFEGTAYYRFTTEQTPLLHGLIRNTEESRLRDDIGTAANPVIIWIVIDDTTIPDTFLHIGFVHEYFSDAACVEGDNCEGCPRCEGEITRLLPHGGSAFANFTIEFSGPNPQSPFPTGTNPSVHAPPSPGIPGGGGRNGGTGAGINGAAVHTSSNLNAWNIRDISTDVYIRVVPNEGFSHTVANPNGGTWSFRPSPWLNLNDLIEWSDPANDTDIPAPRHILVLLDYEVNVAVEVLEATELVQGLGVYHIRRLETSTLHHYRDNGIEILPVAQQHAPVPLIDGPIFPRPTTNNVLAGPGTGWFNPVRVVDGEALRASAQHFADGYHIVNPPYEFVSSGVYPNEVISPAPIEIFLERIPSGRLYGFMWNETLLASTRLEGATPAQILGWYGVMNTHLFVMCNATRNLVVNGRPIGVTNFYEEFDLPVGGYTVWASNNTGAFMSEALTVEIVEGEDTRADIFFRSAAEGFLMFVEIYCSLTGDVITETSTVYLHHTELYEGERVPREDGTTYSTWASPHWLFRVNAARPPVTWNTTWHDFDVSAEGFIPRPNILVSDAIANYATPNSIPAAPIHHMFFRIPLDPIIYELTFIADAGGSFELPATSPHTGYVPFGEEIGIRVPTVVANEGFTFVGWYQRIAEEGEETRYEFIGDCDELAKMVPTDDYVLIARFERHIYVTFRAGTGGRISGTNTNPTIMSEAAIIEGRLLYDIVPTPTALPGNRFVAWYRVVSNDPEDNILIGDTQDLEALYAAENDEFIAIFEHVYIEELTARVYRYVRDQYNEIVMINCGTPANIYTPVIQLVSDAVLVRRVANEQDEAFTGTGGVFDLDGLTKIGDLLVASSPIFEEREHVITQADATAGVVIIILDDYKQFTLTINNTPQYPITGPAVAPPGQTASGLQRDVSLNVHLSAGTRSDNLNFLGWFVHAEGVTVPAPGTLVSTIPAANFIAANASQIFVMPANDQTLTALWGDEGYVGGRFVLTVNNVPVYPLTGTPATTDGQIAGGTRSAGETIIPLVPGTRTTDNLEFLGWWVGANAPALGSNITAIAGNPNFLPAADAPHDFVMPARNETLTALWGRDNIIGGQFDLTVNNHPANVTPTGQTPSGPVAPSTNLTNLLDSGTATGWTFMGWATAIDTAGIAATVAALADGETLTFAEAVTLGLITPLAPNATMPTINHTVYAIWGDGSVITRPGITLTVNSHPTNVTPTGQTPSGPVAPGTNLTDLLQSGTATGWTFMGWATAIDTAGIAAAVAALGDGETLTFAEAVTLGLITPLAPNATMPTTNHTVYAIWGDGSVITRPGITLTINNHPMNVTPTGQTPSGPVAPGTNLTNLLDSGTATGWTFMGWATAIDTAGIATAVAVLGAGETLTFAEAVTLGLITPLEPNATMPTTNHTVYAIWGDGNVITRPGITLNINNVPAFAVRPVGQAGFGPQSPDSPVAVAAGQDPAGYVFMGWWRGTGDIPVGTPLANITVYEASRNFTFTMPATSETLTALWGDGTYIGERINLTVMFDTNGGSLVPLQEVRFGDTATIPAPAPTREGYTFVRWRDAAGNVWNFDAPITSNMTLFAEWRVVPPVDLLENRVRFIVGPDGGGRLVHGYLTLTVEYGSYLEDQHIPTPEPNVGYRFDNWTAITDGGPITDADPFGHRVAGDITFVANFVPITHIVEFAAGNGGTLEGAPVRIEVPHGTRLQQGINIPAPVPAQGFVFVSWQAFEPYSHTVTDTVTFTAIFEPVLPTVRIEFFYSTTTPAALGVTQTTVISGLSSGTHNLYYTPIHDDPNISFLGWSLDPSALDTIIDYNDIGWATALLVTSVTFAGYDPAYVQVFAVWAAYPNYISLPVYHNVRFVRNHDADTDAVIIAIQSVLDGNTVSPPLPERVGYAFMGWYMEPEAITPFDNSPITSDMTLYARWQPLAPLEYVYVTFTHETGGTISRSGDDSSTGTTVEYVIPVRRGSDLNDVANLPEAFAFEAFEFAGWDFFNPGEPLIVWRDEVITASFRDRVYNVTFAYTAGGQLTGALAWALPAHSVLSSHAPSIVEANGYMFSHWEWTRVYANGTSVSGTVYDQNPINAFNRDVTGHITFVAHFASIAGTFTLAYNANGGVALAEHANVTDLVSGDTVTLAVSPGLPTVTGRTIEFLGWSATPQSGILAFGAATPANLMAAGTTYTMTSSRTFWAVWRFTNPASSGDEDEETPPATEPQVTEPPRLPVVPEPEVRPEPPVVQELFRARFMVGDDMGNFRPHDNITRAETIAILVRTMLPHADANTFASTNKFSDVSPSSWYSSYIAIAYSHGLIQGFPDGTFRPTQPITREEFAAMLARTTTLIPGVRLPFTDAASAGGWAFNYIHTVTALGWMHGDAEGTFRPIANMSRAEAAATLNRLLGRVTTSQSIAGVPNVRIFPDAANANAWHYYYVIDATNSRWFIPDDRKEFWLRVVEYVNNLYENGLTQ